MASAVNWQRGVTTRVGWFVAGCALIGLTAATAAAQGLSHAQGPSLGTNPIGGVDRQLAANGGDGTYTWSLISGALPPGVSLRTDVPSFYPANADAGLMGVATTPGSYSFTLRVASAGASADRAYTWRITSLTIADSSPLPDAYLSTPYALQLTAQGGAGPVSFAPSSPTSIPSGMTLSAAGLLAGSPSATGSFSVGFQFTDGTDTVFWSLRLSVFALNITNDGLLPNATQGDAYSTVLTATGGTAPYTFAACPGNTVGTSCAAGLVALPAGLLLASDGTISGIPTGGAGKSAFTATVTDALGQSYSKLMALNVVGDPPRLPRLGLYSSGRLDDCTVGNQCSAGLFVSSGGAGPFTWSASGLPPGLAIRVGSRIARDYITPGDAEIWGVPTVPGDYNIEVTVTDATGLSSTNTVQLRIARLSLNAFLANGTIGVAYSSTLRVLGGQLPYTAQLIAGRLPAGLTFNPATLTVSGTPLENAPATSSFDPLFRFTDALGNVTERHSYFNIANNATTVVITSGADLGTRAPGTATSITLGACCLPTFTWSLVSGTLPPGLALTSSGVLGGTPSTEGTFTFLLRAADPTNVANAAFRQFTLRISALSITGPLADVANVNGSVNLEFDVTGGTEPLAFQFTPFTLPPPGLSVSTVTGVLSGTFSASGQYFFSIDVTDALGRVATRSYTISVYPVGVNPPLNITNLNAAGTVFTRMLQTITFELQTSGGTPPYSYSWTPGAAPIPGLRVQSGLPQPTGFANTGGILGVLESIGTFGSSVRVTDSAGAFVDRDVTYVVTNIAQRSLSPLPRGAVGVPYSHQMIHGGDSGNIVWTVNGALPAGLTLSPSGLLSGTPTLPFLGTITLALDDLTLGERIEVVYTLNIDPYPIVTPGVLPSTTSGIPYSQTLSAPGCGSGCTFGFSGTPPLGLTGLTLSAAGVLSGTPTGTFNGGFTVVVAGSNGTAQKVFALQIASATTQALAITTTAVGPNVLGAQPTIGLFAFGGAPPYSWSVIAGALPPGAALRAPGESVGQNLVPGVSYLAGRPMQAGAFTFTLQVTDSAGATASREFTWVISRLSFQTTALPLTSALQNNPLVYNVPYSQQLLVIGGTGNYTFSATSPMPPGLSLSPSGLVSGTPLNTGAFTVPIQVIDTAGNVNTLNHAFTIASGTAATVGFQSNAALTIQPGFPANINVGPNSGTAPYTVTLLTPLPPQFALLGGNANVASIAANSFFVVGTPAASGSFSFTVRIEDAVGNIGVRTFTINVTSFSMFNTVLGDVTAGVAFAQAPVLFNPAGTTWSVSPTSALPPGLTLSPSGLLSGTIAARGIYSFGLVATDPAGVVVSGLTPSLRVSNHGIADPLVLPTVAVVGEPFSYSFTGTSSGGVWSATGLPAGLTMSGSGVVTGTPTQTGSFTVVVTVTDGVVPFQRRFTLFSRLPNAAILTSGLTNAVLADVSVAQTVNVTLNASGGLPPYSWSVAPGSTLPAGVQLIVPGLQLPTFQPGTTILCGMPTVAGDYTFDLILSDSAGASLQRTFTLKVTPVNVVGITRTAVTGVPFTLQFTGTGGTAPYTFEMSPSGIGVDMLPPGLTFSPAGVITGTPVSTGAYQFILRAIDAVGQSFTRTQTLTVNSPSGLRVTSGNPNEAWAGRGRASTLTTNGGSTYSWSLVGGALPPGVSLIATGTGTALVGPPAAAGVYMFTLRATDTANAANTAERVFTYRVTPLQAIAPPLGTGGRSDAPDARVGTPYSYLLKTVGGIGPYTYSVTPFGPLPPGLSLSSSGLLSGTPTSIGTYQISVQVMDAAGAAITFFPLNLRIASAGVPASLIRLNATAAPADGSVGVPFINAVHDIGRQFLGGTPPYALSVASGSSLPPGLVLLTGGQGISDFIGGVPTAAGVYPYSLVVSDTVGQTLVAEFTTTISPIAVSPETLAPARVGTFYSLPLVPSGGVAPYTWALNSPSGAVSDMPPGLSLNAAGLLSGIPSSPGIFRLVFTVFDAAASSRTVTYLLAVDNAASDAPAVNVTPDPIQVFYEQGTPAPAPLAITVGSTGAALPFSAIVTGIPGAALSANAGSATSLLSLSFNVAGLPVGTYRGVVAARALDSTNQFDGVPVTLVVSPTVPCTFTLDPQSGTLPATGGIGGFSVQTGPACSWNASGPPPSVLQFTSPKTGTGNGSVTYNVLPNTGANPRTLTIFVGGKQHNITQFGSTCSYALNPARFPAPAGGGGATIAITPGDASCASWTSAGLSASPSTGSSSVQSTVVTVPPNTGATPRTLTATIAGRTLTVDQAGAGCTVGLSPYTASSSAAGGQGSIGVTIGTGCTYETTPNASWISVVSGGTGTASGTLVYSVQPNTTTVSRSGTLTIGGQTFLITQAALACSVTLNTSGLGSPFGPAATAGAIAVTTNGSNCTWTATSAVPWATVSPTSGTGNGSVGVTIGSNAGSIDARVGSVTIAAQNVALSQDGTTCSYALQSPSGTVPAAGGNGSVGVTSAAVCGWTSTSSDPSWLTITAAGTSGSGSVQFVALANPSATPRSATLTIAGLSYSVSQAGAACQYALPTSTTTVAAAGASSTFAFSTTFSACTPVAQSYAGWIAVATTFSGSSGSVAFTVSPNPSTTTRVGTIRLGEQIFTLTQTGGTCGFSLNANSAAFGPAGDSRSVLGSPSALGCVPTVGTDQPSFITLGALFGPVSNIFTLDFTIAPFASITPATRLGKISFGGQLVAVKQTSY